ncbi:MAG: RNA methyltransferase [Calditrichaceae bacterium]|nr:RNA methyltransferase [Calditrichaceae bacterium]
MNKSIKLSEKFKRIQQNVHFVLVEPENPGNIGAVARAMKTSGFKNLTLINYADLDHPELRMMAHRSLDIVKNAKILSSLNEAIGKMRLTVATTMRKRYFKFPFYNPQELCENFLPLALHYPIAIVFGRERTGLTNEELVQCQLHSTIKTATQNPALNLAQAVMIYAHTFFLHLNQIEPDYKYDYASQYEIEKYYEHLLSALKMVNFIPRDGYDEFITRVRRFIGRSNAESRDIRLLHKLLQIFETRINDLEKSDNQQTKREIF